MDFGYMLRTMRKAAGMSLRRLARQIGVSPAYLSQVERGSLPAPTLLRMQAIAKALQVREEYLLGLTDRLNAELLAFVGSVPEAGTFLKLAKEKGFGRKEFRTLVEFMEGADKQAVLRALRRGGRRRDRVPPSSRSGPQVSACLNEKLLWHRLRVRTKRELLRTLAEGVAGLYASVDPNLALNRLLRREREASTGIGQGLAVPHATMPGLCEEVVGLATLSEPIAFGAVDNRRVDVVFCVAGPEHTRALRLHLLARIASLASLPGFLGELRGARTRGDLLERLRRAEWSLC